MKMLMRTMSILSLFFFVSALGGHFLLALFFVDDMDVLFFYDITIEQVFCFIPLILVLAGGTCLLSTFLLFLI